MSAMEHLHMSSVTTITEVVKTTFHILQFSLVQSLNCAQLFVTPWNAASQASLFFTISQSLHKLMSIESVMLSKHLVLRHPLFLLPSIFPRIRVFFKWVSSLHQVAKVLELQLQHQSMQWYSGLISFRIDWFDLLAVQRTLKDLLQHHSSKASIPRFSTFFMVQLSHPYYASIKNKKIEKTDK